MAKDNQIAMRVSDEKKRQIRTAAAQEDWDMADFLREASDRLLEEMAETEGEEGNGMSWTAMAD